MAATSWIQDIEVPDKKYLSAIERTWGFRCDKRFRKIPSCLIHFQETIFSYFFLKYFVDSIYFSG